MLVDTHAHLDFNDFKSDRKIVIDRAREAGVSAIINPGCDLESSKMAINLAQTYDCIYASGGIHPNSSFQSKPVDIERIKELAKNPKVVAIGEIGLDFYRNRAPRELQIQTLKKQCAIAQQVNLPVIIHFRQVEMDGIDAIGRENIKELRGVFHCFGGSVDFAMTLVSWGFYIGFDGPLTYEKSDRVEIALKVPLENILLETDSPFLPPQRYRGKRNEPAFIREIADTLADIKQCSVSEVISVTRENARTLFHFDNNHPA